MSAPTTPKGTKDDPFTHAVGDPKARRRKYCRCSVCGNVETCTPTTDFWGKDGAPLRCEPCFDQKLSADHPGALILDLRTKDKPS